MSGTFLSLYPPTYYDMLTSESVETDISPSSWVIDSGATHHVSHKRSLFLEFKDLVNTFVKLPNETTVSIVGISSIRLTDNIILHEVLYIPVFRFNLLNVSRLTKHIPSVISFTSTSCFIQDLTQELMLGQGSQIANLYILHFHNEQANFTLQGTSCSVVSVVDYALWHTRLGILLSLELMF